MKKILIDLKEFEEVCIDIKITPDKAREIIEKNKNEFFILEKDEDEFTILNVDNLRKLLNNYEYYSNSRS